MCFVLFGRLFVFIYVVNWFLNFVLVGFFIDMK